MAFADPQTQGRHQGRWLPQQRGKHGGPADVSGFAHQGRKRRIGK